MSIIHLPWLLLAATAAQAADDQAAARSAAAAGWSAVNGLSTLTGVAALAALGWLIWRLFFRRDAGTRNDPRHLLRELCQAHGLSRRAERLLRKAATALGTPHPGRFFLEPRLLEQAGKCEQLRASRRALILLHERLFGEESG